MIEAGKLRHRVRIERYADLVDSSGEVIQDQATGEVMRDWVVVDTVWCAIEPLSSKEFIAAQATQSQVTARIVIRHRDDINAAMRLMHERIGRPNVMYNIHGILADKDSGLEYLTLPVSTGVSTSGQ